MKHLYAALAEVQGAVKSLERNATNPHFGNKYTTLEALIEGTRDVLLKLDLVLTQSPGFDGEHGILTLQTTIFHIGSGESVTFDAGTPLQKQDPQGVGSAITYLRRYTIQSILGIASEDDDGNAASGPTKELTANDKIGFGKYSDETFKSIAAKDPD
jgi:hypothetical protein